MKFLTTISAGGIFLILSMHSLWGAELPDPNQFRVKSSGESITSSPPEDKPELPAFPLSNNPTPPSENIIYHHIPEGAAAAIPIKPEGPFVDHEVFDRILRKYVTKNGWVDYRELKKDKESVSNLQNYIRDLLQINPSTLENHRDQLASWLNLYNAIVLNEILSKYPVNNVLKIHNLYGQKKYLIGENRVSLLDIEEEIFRKELQDSRTVFCRVNGASSGPKFFQGAFDAKKIDQQMEDRTREFFKNPENVRADLKGHVISLNSTFLWYEKDFLNLPAYVGSYLNLPAANYRWAYLGYDWKLNDSKLH